MRISLVQPNDAKTGFENVFSFNPRHTYSLFGNDEEIVGYKDLSIYVRYRASDMNPHLQISYSEKADTLAYHDVADGTNVTDVEAILRSETHFPPCELLLCIVLIDG